MAQINAIQGVTEVLRNMRQQQQAIGRGVNRGLRRAGLFLQRESQKRVPVDMGGAGLKGSAFTRAEGAGFRTKVTVGYTASYAIYVHESVEMKLKGQKRTGKNAAGQPRKGRYWDPQGRAQAKFLEGPMREFAPQIREIIRREGRIR